MRLNYETCIVGKTCVLVPYRQEHVPKYHEWMQNEDLLHMTGSEPLSLEEEIEMQQSWRDDPNKCTFIVLARNLCDFGGREVTADMADDSEFCQRNLAAMVGDVNLFFSEEEEEEVNNEIQEATPSEKVEKKHLQAEIDIMIAEAEYRGKGLGKEATCLMMRYGAKTMDIRRFFCKIKENNSASLSLFKEKLGFRQCAYAACFQEVELERKAESSDALVTQLSSLLRLGEDSPLITFPCTDESVTTSVKE